MTILSIACKGDDAAMFLFCQRLLKKHIQFIKFAIVGASNTAITFVSYYLLIKLGLHYSIANILAYCVGIVNSYIFNSIWVFKSTSERKSTASKFLVVNLAALSLSTALLFLFVDMFGVNELVAQIIVTLLVLVVNYTANKLWTFKAKEALENK